MRCLRVKLPVFLPVRADLWRRARLRHRARRNNREIHPRRARPRDGSSCPAGGPPVATEVAHLLSVQTAARSGTCCPMRGTLAERRSI